MSKCDFNKVALQSNFIEMSHFGMGVLVQICCIFSEHLFLRTPLEGCFWADNLLWILGSEKNFPRLVDLLDS